jgi:hypothetical protein
VGHRFDGVRGPAACAPDADVVERDHASIGGERVDEGGIPVVEIPAEVLQQDERDVAFAKVPVVARTRVAPRRRTIRRGLMRTGCFFRSALVRLGSVTGSALGGVRGDSAQGVVEVDSY